MAPRFAAPDDGDARCRDDGAMRQSLAHIALIFRHHDEANACFTETLGFDRQLRDRE